MLKRVLFTLLALAIATTAIAENRPVTVTPLSPAGKPDNGLPGLEIVAVPGGCFLMGSNRGNSNERPVHEVCVSPFYIGKYEVTQGLWSKVMGYNPSRFDSCGSDCPVEQVSWPKAQEFISKLNRLSGKNYRLPTEAEWEYACRGGGSDETYCGSNNIDEVAWYDGNSSRQTHPVGQKKPNKLGIFDMSGNVWEWVQDYWKVDYSGSRKQDPAGPQWNTNKVRRGGSWQYGHDKARTAWRSNGYTDDHALDIGFRLVLPAAK